MTDKRLKEEALAKIKDPTVREYYRAELDMAEDLEGTRTGGIFDVPGVEESGYVTSPLEVTTRPKRKLAASFVPGLVAVLVACAAAALTWWLK